MRNERMEKVIAYLNKHYTESIGLDEIASYTAITLLLSADTLKKTQEKIQRVCT